MRIAVYHHLPSGGAKRMMYEIIRLLSSRHDFYVYTYSDSNHEFCDIRPYVKEHHVFPFERSPLFNSPFGRLNQFLRWLDLNRLRKIEKVMAAEIESRDFDLIWVNPCQVQNSPSIISSLHSKKILFLCQEPLRILYEQMPQRPYDLKVSKVKQILDKIDPFFHLFFSALKKNDRRNVKSAQMVVVNSQHMSNTVSSIYNIHPLINYGGVDLDFFKPVTCEKENYLFSVGSLTPLKNFDFLIRAIGTLPKKQRVPLLIASNFSNPQEKNFLVNLAAELNVELRLESGISDVDLRQHYNQAKFVIYAPIREPFGLVAIESMACGTAIIGVAEGGLTETIIHNTTGLLTKRDEKDFGIAIQSLLSDKQLLDKLGLAGRQEVEQKWSWNHTAVNFEEKMRELATGTNQRIN